MRIVKVSVATFSSYIKNPAELRVKGSDKSHSIKKKFILALKAKIGSDLPAQNVLLSHLTFLNFYHSLSPLSTKTSNFSLNYMNFSTVSDR